MTRESLERVDRELSSEQEIEKRTESSECVRSSQESSGGEASIVRGREPMMEECVGDCGEVHLILAREKTTSPTSGKYSRAGENVDQEKAGKQG